MLEMRIELKTTILYVNRTKAIFYQNQLLKSNIVIFLFI